MVDNERSRAEAKLTGGVGCAETKFGLCAQRSREYMANCHRAPLPESDFAESGRSYAHLPPASLLGDNSKFKENGSGHFTPGGMRTVIRVDKRGQ